MFKKMGMLLPILLLGVVSFGLEQYWKNHYPMDIAPYVLMDTFSHD